VRDAQHRRPDGADRAPRRPAAAVGPHVDAPGRSYAFGWCTSSRKLTGPAGTASDLGAIDAVLLSHDNLDDDGRALLPAAGSVARRPNGDEGLGG
jgi:hypothetical protein